MATNQQPQGGNSMAALLGNMRGQVGQPPPQANYGGGLQAPMQNMSGALGALGPQPQQPMQTMGGAIGPYQRPMQEPIPPGGAGYPQMSPDAMQNMMGQISARRPALGAGMGAPQSPSMPSFGQPAGGAGGGKGQVKQAIGQLPGGPQRRGGGLGGGPRGPGAYSYGASGWERAPGRRGLANRPGR
jgi:hypothetical protein